MAINCGEAIGPSFGGILTNIYKFEIACKATSFLNICYALIYAIINMKIIKNHISNSTITNEKPLIDNEYSYIKYTEMDYNKDRIKDRLCYTPKCRGYSFASLNSKKTSFCNTVA